MIQNKVCPYCLVVLTGTENDDACRSVEHLVPNTALSEPFRRKNDLGDFYACRKCNSAKSNIDYVLGVIAKTQSRDPQIASSSMIQAVSKKDGRVKRFRAMLRTTQETPDGGALMTVPFSGEEILRYSMYLAKGQYFKKRGRPLLRATHSVLVSWFSKEVTRSFEQAYEAHFGANNFRDLERNPHTEVIVPNEAMIHSKNNVYLFVFHDYVAIGLRIKARTKKTAREEAENHEQLIQDFA